MVANSGHSVGTYRRDTPHPSGCGPPNSILAVVT